MCTRKLKVRASEGAIVVQTRAMDKHPGLTTRLTLFQVVDVDTVALSRSTAGFQNGFEPLRPQMPILVGHGVDVADDGEQILGACGLVDVVLMNRDEFHEKSRVMACSGIGKREAPSAERKKAPLTHEVQGRCAIPEELTVAQVLDRRRGEEV